MLTSRTKSMSSRRCSSSVAGRATGGDRAGYGYDAGRNLSVIGLCLLMVMLQVVFSPCSAESSVATSWESEGVKQKPTSSLCTPVEPALILPTIASQRSDAIAQLEHSPIIEIDERTAARMVEASGPKDIGDSASSITDKAIAALEERKRRELVYHEGSWSLADQSRLNDLEALKKNGGLSSLRSFLVRAIAKNEFTGAFQASVCGKTLSITQSSLGKSTPASIPLPVVVFLKSAPTNLYLSWDMAE